MHKNINKGKEHCDFLLEIFNKRLHYKNNSDLLNFTIIEGGTNTICNLHFNLYNKETDENEILINIQHDMGTANDKSKIINDLWLKLADSIVRYSIWSLSNKEFNLKSFRSYFKDE